MTHRRIKTNIYLDSSATTSQIQAIVRDIRQYLNNDNNIDKENISLLVHFHDISTRSIEIFLYFFTKETRWAPHLDIRQACLLEIRDIVHRHGVKLSFPEQSRYIDTPGLGHVSS